MFIGHWAPAMVAAVHPRAPGLGTLFIAGQLVDWAFFGFVLAGVEHMRLSPGISAMNPLDLYHMPYTHSLAGSIGFAALFAGALWLWRRDAVTALIGAGVVVSHWVLDFIVHIPDLTLWGDPPRLGLGLWNHPGIAMPLELGLTIVALLVYLVRTRAVGAANRIAVGLLALALLTVQMVNWFGPPPQPQGVAGNAITALAAYALITALAAWVGAGRVVRA